MLQLEKVAEAADVVKVSMSERHHVNVVTPCSFELRTQMFDQVDVWRFLVFTTSPVVEVHQDATAVREHDLAGVAVTYRVKRYLVDYFVH